MPHRGKRQSLRSWRLRPSATASTLTWRALPAIGLLSAWVRLAARTRQCCLEIRERGTYRFQRKRARRTKTESEGRAVQGAQLRWLDSRTCLRRPGRLELAATRISLNQASRQRLTLSYLQFPGS